MDLEDKRFVVGIDLGTTNTAVSYVDLVDGSRKQPKNGKGGRKHEIHVFQIPQPTGPGEFARQPILPSFLYLPGTYDISDTAVQIPWSSAPEYFAGIFAREHGAKVPSRLVSSAKSWLCHSNIDRKAKILPWGAGDEIPKVSPVEATAAYLNHIREAWNYSQKGDETRFLENQLLIITVPASFDEVARDLTLEAASLAGLKEVTLLEEPLAAFYSWLIAHETDWANHVQPNELILVCDVGGGTTDFTLITLREVEGSPRFERIAVGDHLILGGDNIDFALARLIEMQGGKQKPQLSQDRWKTLCHRCRQAKENILAGETDREKITLMGEGGRLIAGTLSAELNRENLEQTVVEGFFPLADANTACQTEARKGISELGLPFEQEPAITKHLGWFLERHAADVEKIMRKRPMPDLVLFNGGSLKPTIIQDRIRAAIRRWFGATDDSMPRVLANPDPFLAVAMGASYYGLVKAGRGVRVGSGSPRGYYLGIATQSEPMQSAAADVDGAVNHAICLVERGLDEGTRIELKEKKFEVLTNQPVTFDLYSSSFRSGDRSGDVVMIDETLSRLPPIQTIVQFGKKGVKSTLPVNIEAEYTEIGSLALWCKSLSSHHRWRLQFQLRGAESEAAIADTEVFDEDIVTRACRCLEDAFASDADKSFRATLVKTLAETVARPKEKWPLSFIRRLADFLLENESMRAISPDHESRWLNMVGFCMRPGFGDSFDPQRMRALWKIYQQGLVFINTAQVMTEWWILLRRIAGGLKPGQQRQVSQDLTPVIMPKKGAPQKLPVQQRIEMWMAIANMELLHVKDKIKWGDQLLSELKPKKTKPQLFWALSRLGARELLYGPADRVISPAVVTRWIETLLEQNWRNSKPVGTALLQLARKTGDRARDLDPESVDTVSRWLAQLEDFSEQLRLLHEVVPVARQDSDVQFGESLPAGLVMKV